MGRYLNVTLINKHFHEKHCITSNKQPLEISESITRTGQGNSDAGFDENYISEPIMVSSALQSNSTVYRAAISKDGTNIPNIIKVAKIKALITSHSRSSINYYSSLSLAFKNSTDASQITDPPVVFRSQVFRSLKGSNLEENMQIAYDEIMKQIEDYQTNGS